MKKGILFCLSLSPSLRQMHLTKIDCFGWNEKWLSFFRSPLYVLVITSETVFFWLLLRPTSCFLFEAVTELRSSTGCCENDCCSQGLCENAGHLFYLKERYLEFFESCWHCKHRVLSPFELLTIIKCRVWLFIVLYLSQANTVLKAGAQKSFQTLRVLGPFRLSLLGYLWVSGFNPQWKAYILHMRKSKCREQMSYFGIYLKFIKTVAFSFLPLAYGICSKHLLCVQKGLRDLLFVSKYWKF